MAKPFKICDADRSKQIGVVASTIDDVKTKYKKYFEVEEKVRIVEESDGTMLEDNEYFEMLPNYVLLMALKEGEQWKQRPVKDFQLDSTQATDQTDSLNDNELEVVARSIKINPARIPLLTLHELQLLADASSEELAEITQMRHTEVSDLQRYCHRRLTADEELKDGIELLRLYHQANPLKK
ncbi:DNA fragmentation factor subunit alpha-like [Anneissia japonica]|uniref:DNA fragmentation factor subunit alpha-like n=1 Tax=Anneissia japonica TaxID=1529436 RepID=UPI0014257A49|nr:DNA fragmentation factor subunit alpha-like [Anneissia japonica]